MALAAACCGGGVALPSIISWDDKAQLSMIYSVSSIVVDNVDTNGVWREWNEHPEVQTLRLEAAHLITDRLQAGIVAPFSQRSRLDESSSGIGDLSTSLGYEFLPDWDYHPIRPKGIGFLQLTLPTGKARAESEVGGMDSRGNGFLALGVGSLFTKTFGSWDAFNTIEVHRSFRKKIQSSQFTGVASPGFGGSLAAGVGFNSKTLRLGGAITWVYEDPIKLESASASPGSLERYATGSLSLAYMPADEWSGILTYSDQTLFGAPVNTSLGRTAGLQIQRRWGR